MTRNPWVRLVVVLALSVPAFALLGTVGRVLGLGLIKTTALAAGLGWCIGKTSIPWVFEVDQ
jgi:hypothetical protein